MRCRARRSLELPEPVNCYCPSLVTGTLTFLLHCFSRAPGLRPARASSEESPQSGDVIQIS